MNFFQREQFARRKRELQFKVNKVNEYKAQARAHLNSPDPSMQQRAKAAIEKADNELQKLRIAKMDLEREIKMAKIEERQMNQGY